MREIKLIKVTISDKDIIFDYENHPRIYGKITKSKINSKYFVKCNSNIPVYNFTPFELVNISKIYILEEADIKFNKDKIGDWPYTETLADLYKIIEVLCRKTEARLILNNKSVTSEASTISQDSSIANTKSKVNIKIKPINNIKLNFKL